MCIIRLGGLKIFFFFCAKENNHYVCGDYSFKKTVIMNRKVNMVMLVMVNGEWNECPRAQKIGGREIKKLLKNWEKKTIKDTTKVKIDVYCGYIISSVTLFCMNVRVKYRHKAGMTEMEQ